MCQHCKDMPDPSNSSYFFLRVNEHIICVPILNCTVCNYLLTKESPIWFCDECGAYLCDTCDIISVHKTFSLVCFKGGHRIPSTSIEGIKSIVILETMAFY